MLNRVRDMEDKIMGKEEGAVQIYGEDGCYNRGEGAAAKSIIWR